MISLNWLPGTAYLFLLLFARVGSILMLVPALGETTIPARMRLSFALALSLVLYPIISPQLPPLPAEMFGIIALVVHEIVIGLIIGSIARLSVSGTQLAGSVIASSSGLSVATAADPINGGVQDALIGAFLSFLGVALIFATDLHHVSLSAISDSYLICSATDVRRSSGTCMAASVLAPAVLGRTVAPIRVNTPPSASRCSSAITASSRRPDDSPKTA